MKAVATLIFSLVMLSTLPATSSNWVNIPSTATQFESSSFKTSKAGVTTVWFKQILNEKMVKETISPYYESSGYSHTLFSDEYNCYDKTYRVTNVVHYANDGHTISSTANLENAPFLPVVPDSTGDSILSYVCDFAAHKKKTK